MSIQYKSTRGTSSIDFEHVVLGGLAPDKGLYVPTSIPNVSVHSLSKVTEVNSESRNHLKTLDEEYVFFDTCI